MFHSLKDPEPNCVNPCWHEEPSGLPVCRWYLL